MINTEECDEGLDSKYGTEVDEQHSLRGESLVIEHTQLEELLTLDADWILSNTLTRVKGLLLQELVHWAEFEPIDGSEDSVSKKKK